jgi:hypothetical protein
MRKLHACGESRGGADMKCSRCKQEIQDKVHVHFLTDLGPADMHLKCAYEWESENRKFLISLADAQDWKNLGYENAARVR